MTSKKKRRTTSSASSAGLTPGLTLVSAFTLQGRIREIVGEHEPDQVDKLPKLLEKWAGREGDLYKALCDKLGVTYKAFKLANMKSLYSVGTKLGKGGFALVRKCKLRSTGEMYALKVMSKKHLSESDLEMLKSEVSIMQGVRHPSIVRLYDVFDSKIHLCMVIDLCEGGELFDRIIELGHFSEKEAAICIKQLLSALEYLHQRDIVHRDLKPENLLFSRKLTDIRDKEKRWELKLIDFGLAGSIKERLLRTPCGTPNYVAPEILQRKPYGTTVDMWSAGVLLYILLCGFPPFYDENDDMKRLYSNIKKARFDMPSPYWDNISTEGRNLVRELLVANPKARLTASAALEHPWFSAVHPETSAISVDFLKRFQYVKRLRRGVRCVLAVLRLIETLTDADSGAVTEDVYVE